MGHSTKSTKQECSQKKQIDVIKYIKSKLIKTRHIEAECVTAGVITADEIRVKNPIQGQRTNGARGNMVQNDNYIPNLLTSVSSRSAEGKFQASYFLPAVKRDFISSTNCGSVISQAFTNINMANDLDQLKELDLITFLSYTRVNGNSIDLILYNTQTRTWEYPVPGTSIEPYLIFNLKIVEPSTGGDKTINLATSAVLTDEEIKDVLDEQSRLVPCGTKLPESSGRIVYTNVIDARFDFSQPFQPLVFTSYSANYVY